MNPFPLVGGSYLARSTNFDAQKTINLYPEMSGSGTSKSIAMLIGTPGLKLFKNTLPGIAVRGIIRINSNQVIVIAGNQAYSMTAAGVITVFSTVAAGTTPVSMAYNGQVVMMVDGTNGYIISPSALTSNQIVDVNFHGADKVDFIGGYFVWNRPGTQQFQWWGPYALFATPIDPLDFASAEGSPDAILSLIVDHNELWLLGENSTEVFALDGNADTIFSRINGAFIEQGIAAKNSIAKMDNTLIWLASDDRGFGTVQKTQGYTPQRISDHALELAIQSYSTISDAVAYTYQQEGHYFYMLTFPTANATWCFDTSTGLWHQRAYRDPTTGQLGRHRSLCHVNFAGKQLVTDYANGNIYSLDLDTYTDNGDILPAIRQCPHIATGNQWEFFSRLWVDMQTGVGLVSGQGSDPVMLLEWSDDGGATFPNAMTVKIGKMGERKARAIFRRLGKSRDRVWRVSITDPVKRILIDGGVTFTVGS